MTKTLMQPMAAALAVSAVASRRTGAAAEESDAAAARPNLTLGGQPLVDLLRADPTDLDRRRRPKNRTPPQRGPT